MSLQSIYLCDPCRYEEIHKNATKWCTNCDEGFCGDCEKVHRATKMSRNHSMITIEDFQKISDVTVCQNCEEHGKKLDLYCKSHDSVLCIACVPCSHRTCSNVIPLEEASKYVKTSTALADLEELISGVLRDVQNFIHDRDLAYKNVERQEKKIKKEIATARAKINQHLDEIEKRLLIDLTTKYDNCKMHCERILKHLQSKQKMLIRLNEQTSQMKQFASDVQVFLGTREFNSKVHETIRSVTEEIKTLQNYKFEVKIHPGIISLLKEVNSFGNIKVDVTQIHLNFKLPKTGQAQILAPVLRNVNDVQLKLRQLINIKVGSGDLLISGCIILPSGKLLIADSYGKKQLMEYSQDGKHIRNIPVSSKPYDLTLIGSDRIAVSYGVGYIEILNIKDNNVEIKSNLEGSCLGISYQDGKLYTVVKGKGIVVTDLSGKPSGPLNVNVNYAENITTAKGRIYYSELDKNEVKCCSMAGEEIWKFRDSSVVRPHGLAIDSFQNVFVVGRVSNTLTIISHDGKTSRSLLTSSDGLDCPQAICYSKDQRVLLVCNRYNGKGALFEVT